MRLAARHAGPATLAQGHRGGRAAATAGRAVGRSGGGRDRRRPGVPHPGAVGVGPGRPDRAAPAPLAPGGGGEWAPSLPDRGGRILRARRGAGSADRPAAPRAPSARGRAGPHSGRPGRGVARPAGPGRGRAGRRSRVRGGRGRFLAGAPGGCGRSGRRRALGVAGGARRVGVGPVRRGRAVRRGAGPSGGGIRNRRLGRRRPACVGVGQDQPGRSDVGHRGRRPGRAVPGRRCRSGGCGGARPTPVRCRRGRLRGPGRAPPPVDRLRGLRSRRPGSGRRRATRRRLPARLAAGLRLLPPDPPRRVRGRVRASG